MDNAKIIKHFYEYVISNNLIDEISEYIADNCIVRIGDKIIPAGIEGMKQHMIENSENLSGFKNDNYSSIH